LRKSSPSVILSLKYIIFNFRKIKNRRCAGMSENCYKGDAEADMKNDFMIFSRMEEI
jgi:hypothetical protein